jgi:hypothetical protein
VPKKVDECLAVEWSFYNTWCNYFLVQNALTDAWESLFAHKWCTNLRTLTHGPSSPQSRIYLIVFGHLIGWTKIVCGILCNTMKEGTCL